MIGGIIPTTLADHPIVSQHPAPHNTLPRHQRRQPGRADVTETDVTVELTAPSGSPARQHLPLERPASPGLRCGPQPGSSLPRVVSRSRDTRLGATACARHARDQITVSDSAWPTPSASSRLTETGGRWCGLAGMAGSQVVALRGPGGLAL
jgi:hypothetical protein